LRIRLALGAEIPRGVRLFDFAEGGIACAPELANFRYIVVENVVQVAKVGGTWPWDTFCV
jgi:hypothetical protein